MELNQMKKAQALQSDRAQLDLSLRIQGSYLGFLSPLSDSHPLSLFLSGALSACEARQFFCCMRQFSELLYLTYFSLLTTRTCPLPASLQQSAHLSLDISEKVVAQLVDRSTEWTITIPLPAGKFNLEHFPGSFE